MIDIHMDSTYVQVMTVCPSCYHDRAALVPLTVITGPTTYRLPGGEEIGRGRAGDRFCARCDWSEEGALGTGGE
jgi:hypothetical protein